MLTDHDTREVIRLAGPGCWREKPGVLQRLNRGRQFFECHCVKCAPEEYCNVVYPDGRRCENFRYRPSWNPEGVLCRRHGEKREREFQRVVGEKLGACLE